MSAKPELVARSLEGGGYLYRVTGPAETAWLMAHLLPSELRRLYRMSSAAALALMAEAELEAEPWRASGASGP